MTNNTRNTSSDLLRLIRDILGPILVGATLSALMLKYVFIIAEIPSSSMENTLQINDRIIVNKIDYTLNGTNRFDIVVFEHKMRETDPSATTLVKRIIGVPGDTIQIKNGVLYINDEEQTESYIKEPMDSAFCYDFGPVVVPEEHYFMMGDNRNNSFDGRYWDYTFVHEDKILGTCKLRIKPRIEWIEDYEY